MKVAVAAIIAVGAFFLAARPDTAQAMTDTAQQDTSDAPTEADVNPEVFYPEDLTLEEIPMPNESQSAPADVAAFLYMIRCCEHIFPDHVEDDSCYHIFYSGRAGFNPPALLNQRFYDMTDHPVITGECKRVPLPDAVCEAAGLGPGCGSTGAGAYQIIRPTWDRYRAKEPHIPSFDKDGQDECALRILDDCGALAMITAGNFNGALVKASRIWASLPGSTAQQNPKKTAFATDRFNEGLSLFA